MDSLLVIELDRVKEEIEETIRENEDVSELLEKYGELSIQLAISNGIVRETDSIRGF
jgi:hypothetical protein